MCGLDSAKKFSQHRNNKVYLFLSTFDFIFHPDTKGKSNLVENILPESLETKQHVCKLCMRTFSEDEFEAPDDELSSVKIAHKLKVLHTFWRLESKKIGEV